MASGPLFFRPAANSEAKFEGKERYVAPYAALSGGYAMTPGGGIGVAWGLLEVLRRLIYRLEWASCST
jgi:hypothetical protein